MAKKGDPAADPASDGVASPLTVVGQIIAKLNKQVFLYAFGIVILVAVLGDRIPAAYQNLIYLVVLLAMVVYLALEIVVVLSKSQRTKQPDPSGSPTAAQPVGKTEAPTPVAPVGQQATADRGGAAATGSGRAASGGSSQGESESIIVSGTVQGDVQRKG